MLLSPKQQYVYRRSTSRINICDGAVRSGKTEGYHYAWLRFVRTAPDGMLMMTGKTVSTLQRNVLIPMQNLFGTNVVRFSIGQKKATIAGREIQLEGGHDERAWEKVRGSTLAGVLCDEISLYPESFFTELLGRLSVKGARLLGTTNPDSPYHWLKKTYIDRKDELDLNHFHFKLDDNPFLPDDFKNNLKKEYTGLWYKRLILGQWVLAAGAVYDMWSDDLLFDGLEAEFDDFWASVDYGTNNPFAVSLFGRNRDTGVTVILDELYYDSREKHRQMTDNEYAEMLTRFIGNRPVSAIYIDPSAASFRLTCEQYGMPVYSANNSVLDGIRSISSAFSKKKLLIHPRCKKHVEEVEGYLWDEKAQKRGEDKPLKDKDHAVDAMRYGYYTHVSAPRAASALAWGEL